MGLWDRIVRLLRSNVNDVIDKAEDPEKMVTQIVVELQENLSQVRAQVATAIAMEKQLYQKYEQAQNDADKWQQKAELAVDKGEDDLAREALKRKNTSQSTADGLKQQWEQQKASVATLKASMAKMESKIAEASTKKDLLVARHRRAEAEQRIQSALSTAAGSSAMAAFERMEQKVLAGETQAAALNELNSDSLEEKFAALDSGDADEDLRKLKEVRQAKLLSAGDAK
ncbi:MAG: PspA/IM30 family protein [Candidatus Sericytochromatia bacterium]|nr:PspA/IM30 family protein [Candidatus Sericytochromatia bacterium]